MQSFYKLLIVSFLGEVSVLSFAYFGLPIFGWIYNLRVVLLDGVLNLYVLFLALGVLSVATKVVRKEDAVLTHLLILTPYLISIFPAGYWGFSKEVLRETVSIFWLDQEAQVYMLLLLVLPPLVATLSSIVFDILLRPISALFRQST